MTHDTSAIPSHAATRITPAGVTLGGGVRRTIDIVVASLGLLTLWPVMVIIALVIRIGTPGPAIFRQTRLGRDARHFTFLKFRTFYADARERFPELYAYQFTAADLEKRSFKVRDDPRVTPQGRWLRKSSLDELPNLWNVLRGDMTLVGPRPEIPEMLRYYTGDMAEVFRVRPGVTGAAQVFGRAELSIAESIRIDVDYQSRRTVWTDLGIVARTFFVVFRRDGAY
jgi:lipopolysaccharide/colanic/teichoic acid biosynthesis glycosyltransferase